MNVALDTDVKVYAVDQLISCDLGDVDTTKCDVYFTIDVKSVNNTLGSIHESYFYIYSECYSATNKYNPVTDWQWETTPTSYLGYYRLGSAAVNYKMP